MNKEELKSLKSALEVAQKIPHVCTDANAFYQAIIMLIEALLAQPNEEK